MSVKLILNPFAIASALLLLVASASPVIAGGPNDPPPPTGQPPFQKIKDCPPGDEAACTYVGELIDIENGIIASQQEVAKGGNYNACYSNYNIAMMYQAQLWKAKYLALTAKGESVANAEIDAAKTLIQTGRVLGEHLQACLAQRTPRRPF